MFQMSCLMQAGDKRPINCNRVGEFRTDKFNGCEMQLLGDLSVVRVPIHYGNSAATTTETCHMLECVAGWQTFSHDRFVSGLF